MGVGAGLYMYDVVVKTISSTDEFLFCLAIVTMFVHTYMYSCTSKTHVCDKNIMGLHALHALKIPINGKKLSVYELLCMI